MTVMITDAQRRRCLVERHRIDGAADGIEDVVEAMIALHGTDPATVQLSVLARCDTATLTDVVDRLHTRRTLVRWMGMRRTLFVLRREDVPLIQAAAGVGVADTMRKHLVRQLRRNGTEPPIEGEVEAWLDDVEEQVHRSLADRRAAGANELSTDEPRLRTAILPRAASEVRQNVTTRLLVLMACEAKLVRGEAAGLAGGPLLTRRYRWEPVERWWPDGLPVLDIATARAELARRWLAAFGPAHLEDLQWWTGWTKTATRQALAVVGPAEVMLESGAGIALAGDPLLTDPAPAVAEETGHGAALLPALDPTPMGWKRREWFCTADPAALFDRYGNIGPTVWWDGEIVGGWAVRPSGEVASRLLVDRGSEAIGSVAAAAERLQQRLQGVAVRPTFPTPLERELRTG